MLYNSFYGTLRSSQLNVLDTQRSGVLLQGQRVLLSDCSCFYGFVLLANLSSWDFQCLFLTLALGPWLVHSRFLSIVLISKISSSHHSGIGFFFHPWFYFSSQFVTLLSKTKNTLRLLILRPLDPWCGNGTIGTAATVTPMISGFQKLLNVGMHSCWFGLSYFLLRLWIRCCLGLKPYQYHFDSKEPVLLFTNVVFRRAPSFNTIIRVQLLSK